MGCSPLFPVEPQRGPDDLHRSPDPGRPQQSRPRDRKLQLLSCIMCPLLSPTNNPLEQLHTRSHASHHTTLVLAPVPHHLAHKRLQRHHVLRKWRLLLTPSTLSHSLQQLHEPAVVGGHFRREQVEHRDREVLEVPADPLVRRAQRPHATPRCTSGCSCSPSSRMPRRSCGRRTCPPAPPAALRLTPAPLAHRRAWPASPPRTGAGGPRTAS